MRPGRVASTALLAGLVAGTLDITAACVETWLRSGRGPTRVFLFIATGVFGPEVLQRPEMWPWGLLFHYVIATGWALLFTLAWPRLPKRPLPVGIAYGALVWLLMNKVVVPLSRVPAFDAPLLQKAKAMAILMVCIGIPIALIVSWRSDAARPPSGIRL